MKYFLTIVFCVLAIVSMFVYAHVMAIYTRQWMEQDVSISASAEIAVRIAKLIHNYWYIPLALLLVVIAFCTVELCTKKNET